LEPRDYEEANAKPLLPRVNFNWIQQQQGTTRNNKEQQGTTTTAAATTTTTTTTSHLRTWVVISMARLYKPEVLYCTVPQQ